MSVVEIRVTAKAQNAIIARLVDEFGSQRALAEELGVSTRTIGSWLNFKTYLRPGGNFVARKYGGGMSHDRCKKLIGKLERLTQRSIREIFPDLSKEELAYLSRPRVTERTIETIKLTAAVEKKYLAYEPGSLAAERKELAQKMKTVLRKLSYREREIIKLRYGLEDGYSHTLDEVATVFKVSRERVRRIEEKAIEKLQQPNIAEQLVGFCD